MDMQPEFDKSDYQEIYRIDEMGNALAHIRGLKDYEEEDITGDLFAEYPDWMNEDVHQVLFHKTARNKYVSVLWKDHFEVIDLTHAYSEVGPTTLDECVALFVDEQEAMDEEGKFPKRLKRGVLSEDGIYNMLERNKELMELIDHREIFT